MGYSLGLILNIICQEATLDPQMSLAPHVSPGTFFSHPLLYLNNSSSPPNYKLIMHHRAAAVCTAQRSAKHWPQSRCGRIKRQMNRQKSHNLLVTRLIRSKSSCLWFSPLICFFQYVILPFLNIKNKQKTKVKSPDSLSIINVYLGRG